MSAATYDKNILKLLRVEIYKLTQKEFGQLLGYGAKSNASVSDWENGKNAPSAFYFQNAPVKLGIDAATITLEPRRFVEIVNQEVANEEIQRRFRAAGFDIRFRDQPDTVFVTDEWDTFSGRAPALEAYREIPVATLQGTARCLIITFQNAKFLGLTKRVDDNTLAIVDKKDQVQDTVAVADIKQLFIHTKDLAARKPGA